MSVHLYGIDCWMLMDQLTAKLVDHSAAKLVKGLSTKLLNCLTANHPSNYDCYSSKYLKSKWHRSNHLKFEFLSSQNFNSVHVKVIFPNIKILNVIIPNIGIFALILELLEYRSCPCKHWNFHVILQKIQAFWSYPFKLWNSGLILPNIKNTLPNFWILAFSFKTFKDWSCTSKLWNSGLYPSKHCIYYLILPNIGIHIPFQALVLLLSYSCLTFESFLILPSRTLEFLPYTYNHQKSYLFLPSITGILFLSFQTLEFWLYPSKHLNSYLIVRITGILVLFFQQWSSYLIFQSTGILVLSFQTLEFL